MFWELLKTTRQRQKCKRLPGFTLLELLAVLAICGILVTLLLPAVQQAREAARKMMCASQLRQVVFAIQMHESTYRKYPSNGGYSESSRIADAVSNAMVTIGTDDFIANQSFQWGIGTPGIAPESQPGSWAYAILPLLEQASAYQEILVGSPQPLFHCPSRARPPISIPRRDNNGDYFAANLRWSQTDYAANARLFANMPWVAFHSTILDGHSNTIGIGEKAYDPSVQGSTSWYWDEPIFSGGSKGTARAGLVILNDAVGIPYKENWGSAHIGGAQFALMDGSIQFLNRSIDYSVIRALLSPGSGDQAFDAGGL